MGFLASLLRSPAWLLGNVLNAVGWALQAAALGRGELAWVQPLLLLSVVLSLPLTAYIRRDVPGAREWTGALALVAGVCAFLVGAHPQPAGAGVAGQAASQALAGSTAAVALVGVSLAAWLCVFATRRTHGATMLAIASGLMFALAAALTKATVATGLGFALQWPFYGLVTTTALGFYWMQRAYQSGPLAASFPVIIALDPMVCVLLGVLLFGERLDTSPWSRALAIGGALVALAGIAVLSRSRFIEAPSGEGGSAEPA
ncbi:MAG: hypothetical protein EB084_05470 [Proteobacteria bacterium]|nr:hypothetical protein [Pseudomonadota bacterium]